MSLFEHLEWVAAKRISMHWFCRSAGAWSACFCCSRRLSRCWKFQLRASSFFSWLQAFFVSIKVAGYSGFLLHVLCASSEIIQFCFAQDNSPWTPFDRTGGLGLYLFYLWQDWYLPTYFNPSCTLIFSNNYGEDVVEQLWSIDRYFEFVLLLLVQLCFKFPLSSFTGLLGPSLPSKCFLLALRGAWGQLFGSSSDTSRSPDPESSSLVQATLVAPVCCFFRRWRHSSHSESVYLNLEECWRLCPVEAIACLFNEWSGASKTKIYSTVTSR